MHISRGQSTYLDLLRIGAALTVFLGHVSWRRLSGGILWQLAPLGHEAVVVFFVLSGFVIQHVVIETERTPFEYSVARLGRLYSVVVPALVLTYLCDFVGTRIDPHVYDMSRETSPLLRLMANGLFLSRSWGWHLSLFSNDPFWSLPYEFWYYQFFAAWTFFRGSRRIALLLLAGLLAGPNILGYLPIWLFGVLAYRASSRILLDTRAATIAWAISALGLLCLAILEMTFPIARTGEMFLPRFFSPLDFLTGALVAVNIYATSFIRLPLSRIAKPTAALAGTSFALYLFHMPLLHLAATVVPSFWSAPVRGIAIGTFALTSATALSFLTEHRKQEWRALFRRLLLFLSFRTAT